MRHTRRPMVLPLVGIGWLAGIAAVALWDAPWWLAAVVLALVAAPAALWQRRLDRAAALLATAVVLAAALGGARFAAWDHRDAPSLSRFLGQQATIEGHISSLGDPRETAVRYRVDVDLVTV